MCAFQDLDPEAVLTPDEAVQQLDLGGIEHRVLGRRTQFPADIFAEIYFK